jgi:hypothetical protein
MTAPDKEPLLFSRVTYGAMILAAIGSLATIPFGMRYPMLRAFSDILFGWMMISVVAIHAARRVRAAVRFGKSLSQSSIHASTAMRNSSSFRDIAAQNSGDTIWNRA